MSIRLTFAVRLSIARAGRASGSGQDKTGFRAPTHARVTGSASRERLPLLEGRGGR